MCAEAAAIANMITTTGINQIEYIVVISSGKGDCPPCGACRQRISEFATKTTTIYLCNLHDDEFRAYSMDELLPLQFDAGNLS